MGEEVGSPGLRELCEQHKDGLLQGRPADRLRRPAHRAGQADDLPRRARRPPDRPRRSICARAATIPAIGAGFSPIPASSWRMRSPASPTRAARSRCRNGCRRCRDAVRSVLEGVEVDGGEDGPTIDRDWGEPDLTPAERVFGWNSFEILAFTTGTPERPVNAIPRQGARALPAALRGRHRRRRHHPGAAPPSRPPRLSRRSRCAAAKAASSRRAGSIRPIRG